MSSGLDQSTPFRLVVDLPVGGEIKPTERLTIPRYESEPAEGNEGDIIYRSDTEQLQVFSLADDPNGSWQPVTSGGGTVDPTAIVDFENLGPGQNLFSGLTTPGGIRTANFRKLAAGAGVAITESSGLIALSSSSGLAASLDSTSGASVPLVVLGTNPNFQIKGLSAGANATVVDSGSSITITSTVSTGGTALVNISDSGLGQSLIGTASGNTPTVKRLADSSTITFSSPTANSIVADVIAGAGSQGKALLSSGTPATPPSYANVDLTNFVGSANAARGGIGTLNPPMAAQILKTTSPTATEWVNKTTQISVRVVSRVLTGNTTIVSSGLAYSSTGGSNSKGRISATLASSGIFTVDGVTLASGDRILILNEDQTSEINPFAAGLGAAANGIYVVTISGTSLVLDRASDFLSRATVDPKTFVFAAEGTYADKAFVLDYGTTEIGGASGGPVTFSHFSKVFASGPFDIVFWPATKTDPYYRAANREGDLMRDTSANMLMTRVFNSWPMRYYFQRTCAMFAPGNYIMLGNWVLFGIFPDGIGQYSLDTSPHSNISLNFGSAVFTSIGDAPGGPQLRFGVSRNIFVTGGTWTVDQQRFPNSVEIYNSGQPGYGYFSKGRHMLFVGCKNIIVSNQIIRYQSGLSFNNCPNVIITNVIGYMNQGLVTCNTSTAAPIDDRRNDYYHIENVMGTAQLDDMLQFSGNDGARPSRNWTIRGCSCEPTIGTATTGGWGFRNDSGGGYGGPKLMKMGDAGISGNIHIDSSTYRNSVSGIAIQINAYIANVLITNCRFDNVCNIPPGGPFSGGIGPGPGTAILIGSLDKTGVVIRDCHFNNCGSAVAFNGVPNPNLRATMINNTVTNWVSNWIPNWNVTNVTTSNWTGMPDERYVYRSGEILEKDDVLKSSTTRYGLDNTLFVDALATNGSLAGQGTVTVNSSSGNHPVTDGDFTVNFIGGATPIVDQTVTATTGMSSTTSFVQNFQTKNTGNLTSALINVGADAPTTVTVRLYSSTGPTLLQTQTFAPYVGVGTLPVTVTFSPPVAISKNQTYYLDISAPSPFRIGINAPSGNLVSYSRGSSSLPAGQSATFSILVIPEFSGRRTGLSISTSPLAVPMTMFPTEIRTPSINTITGKFTTLNATPVPIFTYDFSARSPSAVEILQTSVWVTALRTGGNLGVVNDYAIYKFKGVVKNTNGVMTTPVAFDKTVIFEDTGAGGWDANIGASSNILTVTGTGATDTTISWKISLVFKNPKSIVRV